MKLDAEDRERAVREAHDEAVVALRGHASSAGSPSSRTTSEW